MKVLQVIDRLNIGGAERVLVDLSNLLFENQLDVRIMFLLEPGPMINELNPNIPVYVLNRRFKYSLFTLYQCASYVKKYDFIHCHHQYVFNYIKLACLLFGVERPIVLHDHGPNRSLNRSSLIYHALFKPHYYIGVSSSLIEWANFYFKLKSARIYLLPNIVRKNKVVAATKKHDLILVSNIKPEKNQLFAINLAKLMQCRLLIVGQIQDTAYFEEIKKVALNSPIEFITDCTDAKQYIAQAEFGLHTSTSETGPLVLLEYMVNGLPFLSFDTGEVAKICKDQYPEFFVKNLSVTNWASKITEIRNTRTPASSTA